MKNRTLSLLDSAGDLWFATRYGILKYNGENFEFYNKTNDKYKLNFKEIGSIIEVKNGDIIFTSNGANNEFSFMYYRNDVIEYNQKSDEFIYKKELSEKIGGIKILFKDSKKNLIFCSWNKGIFLVNKNIINFNKNDGLTSLFFTTFYEDCEGNYWFGTYDGLSKIKNAFVNVIKNKEETIINSQLSLSSKNVLLGTNEGLFEFAGNKLNKINKIGSQNISQLYQDSKDNIWIITLKELFLYNRKTYQKIENPLKQYITLFEDKNRDIWIFDDKNFAKQNKKGFSIQNNNFDSIVGNIDIWFSVGKRNLRFQSKKLTDKNGIWFVVEKNNKDSLTYFDGNDFVTAPYRKFNFSLIKSKDDCFWSQQEYGINKLSKGKLEIINNSKQLAENTLIKFIQDESDYSIEVSKSDFIYDELGEKISLKDDDNYKITLPFSFPFFGGSYDSLYINSDGNITFDRGDNFLFSRNLARFLKQKRIAPLFADLMSTKEGIVIHKKPDEIIKTVSKFFNVKVSDLKSRKKRVPFLFFNRDPLPQNAQTP